MSETASTRPVPVGTWNVDPKHSAVFFHVRHMGVAKVRGQFKSYAGKIEVTEGSITASGTVDVDSVDSNEAKRDGHLRSPDFFDVENFPELSFSATSVTDSGDRTLTLLGDITIRGVTREIELKAEIGGIGFGKRGDERLALEVTGELNRSDFDMTFNTVLPGGNVLVSDRVWLTLNLETIKQVD